MQALYKTIQTIYIFCYLNAKNSKLVPLSSRVKFIKNIFSGIWFAISLFYKNTLGYVRNFKLMKRTLFRETIGLNHITYIPLMSSAKNLNTFSSMHGSFLCIIKYAFLQRAVKAIHSCLDNPMRK